MPPTDSGFDVATFFRAVQTLSREGVRVSREMTSSQLFLPRQLRYGYLHGATVMYLGNLAWHERQRDPSWPRAADWAWIHEVVCQPDYYERRGEVGTPREGFDIWDVHYCYHGIGHAFIYHSYFHPIEKTGSVCFEPPPLRLISNLTIMREAHRMCMSAPTDYYRQACSFGIQHSLSEWTFGWTPAGYHLPDEKGVPQKSVYFPCDAMPTGGSGGHESAACFDQVFRWLGWGFPGENTTWVLEEIRGHVLGGGKGLTSLCLSNPWSPGMEEGHVQGCIYGMSQTLYILFDKFAAARTEADLKRAPLRERCCHSADGKCSTLWGSDYSSFDISLYNPYHSDYFNASTYTVPEAHCELIWAGQVLPPTHVEETLVTWCSSFVADEVRTGEVPLDAREWHRYLACIKGAFTNLLVPNPMSSAGPDALSRLCPQLLDSPSWVPPTLRRLAYEACDFRFHSTREPRETRYLELDRLVQAAWTAL